MRADIIQIGLQEIGNKEYSTWDNPEVLKYYHEIGHEWVKHDELAWCAAFANWVLLRSGYTHTGKLNARSFLYLGEETRQPQIGDLVVLWRVRPDSDYGHVGFFIRKMEGYIYLLGGNQSNEVNISKYPEMRLIKYIEPVKK